MFLEFYGLNEQPFGVTPDPRFIYPSRTYSKAFNSLSCGIEADRGFQALIAKPGMGKTTLALQLAAAATRHVPVVVVTFEHAPANLTLKLLCARAGVNLRDVQRGYADLAKLRRAAETWEPVA